MSKKPAPKITKEETDELINQYKRRFAINLMSKLVKKEEDKVKSTNKKIFDSLRKKYDYPFHQLSRPETVTYDLKFEISLNGEKIFNTTETDQVNLELFSFLYIDEFTSKRISSDGTSAFKTLLTYFDLNPNNLDSLYEASIGDLTSILKTVNENMESFKQIIKDEEFKNKIAAQLDDDTRARFELYVALIPELENMQTIANEGKPIETIYFKESKTSSYTTINAKKGKK